VQGAIADAEGFTAGPGGDGRGRQHDDLSVPVVGPVAGQGLQAGGFARPGRDRDRLLHLRAVLPCEVLVTARLHPLRGCRLPADGCTHRDGQLVLTVSLPDGSRALMSAEETDVFGPEETAVVGGTALSVSGVRRLRGLLAGMAVDGVVGPVRPWKVVRHARGADVFVAAVEVCSVHENETLAVRSLARARSKMVRRDGHAAAARWAWSVVCDHGGLLGQGGGVR
jgi:hypothetical protein